MGHNNPKIIAAVWEQSKLSSCVTKHACIANATNQTFIVTYYFL